MIFKKYFFLAFLFSNFFIYSQNHTYFVNQQNGNDNHNGLSLSSALKNVDEAITRVSPGDTISIVGTYYNPSYNPNYTYNAPNDSHLWHKENTIKISGLDGNSNAYITLKAYDQNTKILGDGANIIRLTNCSYLRIEGLNLEGEVDRIPMSTAHALQFVYIIADNNMTGTELHPDITDIHYRNKDETNDNDGIVEETDEYTDISNLPVKRPSYIDTRGLYASNCKHIKVVKNTIHHTPGGGLRVSDSKDVEINENEIYRCSARSYSGTHALVVTKTKPIGSNENSISIERNLVHHNYNEIFSWSPKKTKITPRIDEGKGISLQRNNKSDWVNGQGRILVANNLCYWNGFSGVHSNDGYRIDFINNTCFMNSYTNTITYANTDQRGQNIGISSQRGHYIRMINNISVVDTGWGGFALSASNSSNLEVKNNLIYGINGSLAHDSDINDINTIEQDPLFVNTPTSYQNENYAFNFRLKPNSPALNQGLSSNFIPTTDYYNNTRDNQPDLGAIEYISTSGVNIQGINKLILYPNPVKNIIFIKGVINSQNYQVLDLSGRIVKKGKIEQNRIAIPELSKGIYLIKINKESFKIMKK